MHDALERVGKKSTDKALEAAARRIGLEEADDVLARLGAAEMTGKDLVAILYPELQREATRPKASRSSAATASLSAQSFSGRCSAMPRS